MRTVGAALAAVAWLQAAPAAAGGFTQDEGAFYLKLWDRTLIGEKIYVRMREIAELPASYQDHQLGFYFEYGLAEDLTLVASGAPLGYAAYGEGRGAYFGGVQGGARLRLLATHGLSLAAEFEVGGRPRFEVGPPDDTSVGVVEAAPAVGGVWFDGELQLGVGWGWGWASASVGARAFTSSLSPALTGSVQLGYSSSVGFVADLHLTFQHSLAIGALNLFGAGDTRYAGFGLGLSYWFTPSFALSLGVDGVLYAYSNAATPSFSAGIELR